MRRYEAHYIQLALRDAGGSVTEAARLLGMKHHQSLSALLHKQHKNLLPARTAIVPRKRRLIGEQDSNPESIGSEKRTRTIRILHVEDNRVVADAVRETLQVEGWEVETCADGAAALKKILGHEHYDLLLLDYDLPGVSGIELVRRARDLRHRRSTPIIVLSAALGEAEAREAGADMFLHKPEDIRTLVATISGLLSSAEDMES
ncbi:MAG: response regulator [Pyrinomonadaceae bacterium]